MPATSPTKTSSGSATMSATSRGMTSTWIGDSPRVLIASISSSTFIVPIWAVKAAPERPATRTELEDRRELAADAERDAVGDEEGRAVALRLHAEHVGDHHADEEVHERDDRHRVDAHGLELRHRLLGRKSPGLRTRLSSSSVDDADEVDVRLEQVEQREHGRADALHEPQVHGCAAAGGVVIRS